MTRHGRAGFTLIEMMIVVVVMGLAMMIAVPRFRASDKTKARQAATQLTADLELARAKAMARRANVRVVFNTATNSYTGYLDFDRDGVIGETTAERDSLHAFGTRVLPNSATFGRAGQADITNFAGAGAITFPTPQVNFDGRGLTTPFGTRGVVYVQRAADTAAVAAVTVSGAGGIRLWTSEGGYWR
ncbi:MAG TPA: GspH/FimT family pseudopilin [Gemmatimonadales bacterium]|nr:GspH/FimT family pseudopilin [Gemmatimonadales bacterium]